MNRFHVQLWIVAAALFVAGSNARAQPKDNPVQVSGWLQPDTVTVGDTAQVLISLKVEQGYHVNEIPPLSIELAEKAPLVLLKTKAEPDTTRKAWLTQAGYQILDTSKPLVFPAVVAKKAPVSKTSVRLKVTYYYCSDKEGWCSFKTVEVPVRLVVRGK